MIQPAAGLMLPPSISEMMLLLSRIVPPEPGAAMSIRASSRPNPPRYPASVTTKDGSLSLVMMTPSSPANAALNASPATTASHRGRFDESIQRVITAPRAALNPTDRSISPSRSTKTSAMPNVTMNAAWVIRLTRLPADRNSELRTWKYTTITIRPMTTGSAPLSPPRTRRHQMRAYSPSELAIRSGLAVAARSASSGAAACSLSGPVETATGLSGAPPAAGSGPPLPPVCVIVQPSEPLLLPRSVMFSPVPFIWRLVAPVVIRSTADCGSNSVAGPTAASRPR